MLKFYLSQIINSYNRGDAREESYYHILEELIIGYASAHRKKIAITILPKKTEAGNPDFRIWDGKFRIVGYIEAKDFGKDLDDVEDSEQLLRYRKTFPNIILTNFTEFRLYREGQLVDKISITRHTIAQKLNVVPPLEKEQEFYHLLERFFSFSLPNIRSARTLALELAKRTRFLRDEIILIELEEEQQAGRKAISGFYEAFKKFLIGTLTPPQFADLYAQTITYGLFAARTRSNNEFNRELAFKYIPHTIGILRDVFRFISMEDAPKSLGVIVDDIAEVLQVTDVNQILHDYFVEGKGKDPIIHFYETFLAAYDPATRERRGVYYTPEPVVGYIVRAIHSILKTHFHLPNGFASPQVTVLDPAAGTLTFSAEAIKLAVKEFVAKYGEGGKNNFIKSQVLPNFFAFELMMAPYAIGHLKISFLLDELGYHLQDDERFNLYLTNALEMEELTQTEIPGIGSLSEESHLAGKVKKEQPLLVILGNPPYSGMSANINGWTEKLLKEDFDGMQSYYRVDGKPLGEKNPKWLQDDYVKFLRFAQWKIQQAGHGIVGMITNHSYLDNPTFRGMRQSLMNTFNEIYILDLHGNSLKKEIAPDGSKDENVFDIRQGVAIALFVKMKNKKGLKVFHHDLFGLREEKYQWLEDKKFSSKNYKEIIPETPYYFLIQRQTEDIKKYLEWRRINDIFPVNSVGIVTSRDEFVIDFEKSQLKKRLLQFRNPAQSDDIISKAFNLNDKSNWKISASRKQVQSLDNYENHIEEILYRPFDQRYIFYHPSLIERMRQEVMRHMLEKENLGLITNKREALNLLWSHAFITSCISEHVVLSPMTTSYHFPLYLYQSKGSERRSSSTIMMVFDEQAKYYVCKSNIDAMLYEELHKAFKKKPTPEDILYYIYGIFYSNTYREKYAEFLKIDFPRVPFTSDCKLFKQIGKFGKQLAELHLLKSERLNKPIARFQGTGKNDRIEKVQYIERDQRIDINQDKFFEGIPPEVWNYHIGGYQVCNKWLKDRKGRLLSLAEIEVYCKIITAIHFTIEFQKEIDPIY
ncbi:N-6 DNA methylase, partial [candidate division KSB1 bacterium]|nr:N-6 DNA methylase [candidate division KSB1 bacterium]